MRVIGHGVDLVDVERIKVMLADHGERFVERCFTDTERAYADSSPKRRAERYAVRFACKEAVLKVLGTGWRSGIRWRDMEVRRDPMGAPAPALSGRCAVLATQHGITQWHLSLSHTAAFAVASVIGSGDG